MKTKIKSRRKHLKSTFLAKECQDKSYKIILDSLNKIHGGFNKKIVDAHYEIIDHYVKNFY